LYVDYFVVINKTKVNYFHLGSLGILLYTLLSGNTPFVFDRNDSHETILARTTVKLQLTGPTWGRVTDHAKV